jgi:hypothetical protein
MAMAFDEKKLFEQLAKDPVPVKCGEEFDVIVWAEVSLRLGCQGAPTDEEEREMMQLLQGEWISAAKNRCQSSCPKPLQVAGGRLLENVCENDIWRIKQLIRTKCVAG